MTTEPSTQWTDLETVSIADPLQNWQHAYIQPHSLQGRKWGGERKEKEGKKGKGEKEWEEMVREKRGEAGENKGGMGKEKNSNGMEGQYYETRTTVQ